MLRFWLPKELIRRCLMSLYGDVLRVSTMWLETNSRTLKVKNFQTRYRYILLSLHIRVHQLKSSFTSSIEQLFTIHQPKNAKPKNASKTLKKNMFKKKTSKKLNSMQVMIVLPVHSEITHHSIAFQALGYRAAAPTSQASPGGGSSPVSRKKSSSTIKIDINIMFRDICIDI